MISLIFQGDDVEGGNSFERMLHNELERCALFGLARRVVYIRESNGTGKTLSLSLSLSLSLKRPSETALIRVRRRASGADRGNAGAERVAVRGGG